MVHAAIYDVANAILSVGVAPVGAGCANGKTHKVYKVSVEAPASASAEAAVAAHRVLANLVVLQ